MTRVKLASSKDLPKPGQKKAFTAFGSGDDALQILLSNFKGKIHATSAKCTHYGAPLENGVLTGDGCLICPWHGARFQAATGDLEDSPALDNLLSFPTEIDENGDVYVEAEEEQLKGKPGRPVECKGQVKQEGKGLVIIGGGSAAINAVESARKEGYLGKITLISSEKDAPLDRTKLSKGLVGDANALIWRSAAHLKNVLKVDLRTGTEVTGLSLKENKVQTSSGDSIEYDNLLLATGSIAKRLPLPGAKEGELKGVHVIREVGDVAEALASLGDKGDKDAVVIGSSFIGFEISIAMAGQKKAKSVTVVGMDKVPLAKILGEEVGLGLQQAQSKNNGIQFYQEASVEGIEGKDGTPTAVKIKDNNGKAVSIKADVVILGVGARPATDFLSKSAQGFPQLQKDGSIEVDSTLKVVGLPSGVDNVYAAGDIASWPAFDGKSGLNRIEHWNVAGNQGRAVGATVARLSGSGKNNSPQPYTRPPVFWSALGGQLRYVSDGNPAPPELDLTYLDGNPSEGKFLAFYGRKDGSVAAVSSMGRDPVVAHCIELYANGKMLSFEDVKSGKDPLSISLGADK
ncbi:hypothetical protein BDZ90DRAFT_238981 [Jaminaea rosea]|uniref:Rieske domain-containing protein n=1 Tax=Jaminaea rosea TaxID=1569628 RepID=A0A316UTJ3_9BASI|nr:hypothetical protein BDZ90DRAFT_238981 [Jaminaea rosea]PWN28610.1 hypothetical protein BDZ90DRAFT_238981 [Jaminaea rosea]